MKRLVPWIVLLVVAWFAIQGGEYSTTDLFRQRGREARLRAAVDSLQQDIDSLKTLRRALESDPVVQERVAREVYGMVKGEKELVYRFIDTTRSKP